jgi:hypothetical protein
MSNKNQELIKRDWSNFRAKAIISIMGVVFSVFSLWMYVNAYEVLSNKDLNFVESLQPLKTSKTLDSIITDAAQSPIKTASDNLGNFGTLEQIRVPGTGARIFLSRERKNDDNWLFRPNNAHYLYLNKDIAENPMDTLIYASKSWRTIYNPEAIKVGDVIFLTNTRGDLFTFKIADSVVNPINQKLVFASAATRQLTFIVEDGKAGVYYAFSANLRNI